MEIVENSYSSITIITRKKYTVEILRVVTTDLKVNCASMV